MASLKSVALALAVSVFGMSVLPATAHAQQAQSADAKKKTTQRNEYLVKVMTNNGFSDAKAKRVVAAITRYQTDFRKVHQNMAKSRAALRDDNTANDKAAQARIDADKKQLERLKERYKAEISRTLTAGEQQKLAQILAPPKPKKGKGKAKGPKKKGKPKQAQKRS